MRQFRLLNHGAVTDLFTGRLHYACCTVLPNRQAGADEVENGAPVQMIWFKVALVASLPPGCRPTKNTPWCGNG